MKYQLILGCINIRGLNDLRKQSELKKVIVNEQWDIAIISETKMRKTKGKYIYKGWQSYEVLNSSNNEENTKNGLMIIIKKN
jgi:exonuclease III